MRIEAILCDWLKEVPKSTCVLQAKPAISTAIMTVKLKIPPAASARAPDSGWTGLSFPKYLRNSAESSRLLGESEQPVGLSLRNRPCRSIALPTLNFRKPLS